MCMKKISEQILNNDDTEKSPNSTLCAHIDHDNALVQSREYISNLANKTNDWKIKNLAAFLLFWSCVCALQCMHYLQTS